MVPTDRRRNTIPSLNMNGTTPYADAVVQPPTAANNEESA